MFDAPRVKDLVEQNVAAHPDFDNWHGISAETLKLLLVEPVSVSVRDKRGQHFMPMWLVLDTQPAHEAYVVLYEERTRRWVLAHRDASAEYVALRRTTSIAAALDAM